MSKESTRSWAGAAFVLGATLALSGCALVGPLRGPKADSELALAGLQAPVRVLRDAHGIPYIFASSTADLIRAQGFVTAQHRLFQMEGYRAMASGRLAEAIGPAGLANDRQVRLVGLRRNAERHAGLLSTSSRQFLAWYAEGLNAYIAGHAADHPPELRLAGFTPRPWTLQDMLTILHFASWSQAANYRAEATMQKLIDKVGPERALRELAPINVNPLRRRQPAMVAGLPGAQVLGDVRLLAEVERTRAQALEPAGAPDAARQGAAALGAWAQLAPLEVGSNNWVIGGSRSASGAPVVVNDPHLDARLLPGIWHPVGLFAPGIQAVGAALPAVPGILSGRNATTAFGITNAYGDSQDLFVERVAPGRPGHYLDGDQVRPFGLVEEVIRIKDGAAPGGMREEKLAVRTTVRGPIVGSAAADAGGERLLSLRMASAELPGGGIGLDRLLVARNADEVDRAVRGVDLLYFNFVFADKAGAIGFRASGRVPMRASLQGSHPKPAGAVDDWRGFIAPEDMPGARSPASDWLASANHDTRPDDYAHDYSTFFATQHRIRRIAEVLDQARGMRTADQLALLQDVKNLQALRFKPVLVAALRAEPGLSDLARILDAWDGRDDKQLAAPLVYHTLYERLAYETFVDELGEALAREWLSNGYAWQERFDELVKSPLSPWFDDLRTPHREMLPDLVRRAARTVRAELEARHGTDMANWKWGDAHRLTFSSPLRRSGVGRDLLGAAPLPYSGSGMTVQRALSAFLDVSEVESFASLRLVADLGDDDKIEAVLPGGVVDRQFHSHQKDQLAPWAAGRLLPWWFAPDKVQAHALREQTLVPRPAP